MVEEKPSTTPASSATAGTSSSTTKKKRKSAILKIKGFLTGKSKRERKERDSKKMAENISSKLSVDDQSTVYGVNVEAGSVNAPTPASLAAKKSLLDKEGPEEETDLLAGSPQLAQKYLLKVVLLLLDSETRRFELLQLEFDSVQATVSDVLAQIPVSVTEEILKKQQYVGIANCEALSKKSGDLLSDFCKGGDILVATPEHMSPADCVKLALPILSDAKVIAMLKSCGIDASTWKNAKEAAKLALKREKEGLKNPSRAASGAASPKAETRAAVTFHPNGDARQGGSLTSKKPRSGSLTNLLKFLGVVALLAALLKLADTYLSTTISVGRVLSPGTVLHKCGLAGLVPGLQSALSSLSPDFDCENAYLVVDEEKVTGYDSDGNVSWTIVGTHQRNAKYCDVEGEEECKLGLHFVDSKHLVMSGTKITWVEVFQKGVTLDPWPFAEKPLVRTWRK